MLKLVTNGSARRLANQWVDLSDSKRKGLLEALDTESRILVIEHMVFIRSERQRKTEKQQRVSKGSDK
jgi:hypothetical protein